MIVFFVSSILPFFSPGSEIGSIDSWHRVDESIWSILECYAENSCGNCPDSTI